MRLSLSLVTTGLLALSLHGSQVLAMGQRAQVFEQPTEAGIWDSTSEFYLRLDLAEIAGLTNQKFIWAGFHQDSSGLFRGEVVLNDFSPTERRLPAQARILHVTDTARYFLIEVLDPNGAVIKEFFLKGPHRPDVPAR